MEKAVPTPIRSKDSITASAPRNQTAAAAYQGQFRRKLGLLAAGTGLLGLLALIALGLGSYALSPAEVLRALFGAADGPARTVVLNIRLPRILAAVVSGWGMAVSGVAIQNLIKNPLGSPFTLGISQGAAFGASAAIVLFGAGIGEAASWLSGVPVPIAAFGGAMAATLAILALARFRRLSPEGIILAGVALSSLFTSGTVLVQYLATETELASVVFWSFGDVARSSKGEIGLTAGAGLLVSLWLWSVRWDLNALAAGEEAARGLGVPVDRLRIRGMMAAALVAALVTAFHGVIGFLGLLAPHIGRKIWGADHRLLIPGAGLVGALLLLGADTLGRTAAGSGSLPVGVITSFMGAPLFLWLLIRRDGR
jgi:iron complex transport system permease protein